MKPSNPDQLALCQEALREMESEIALLRNASLTFGELADRLNEQVKTLRAQLRVSEQVEAERANRAAQHKATQE
jgi:hypothetical protein